MRGELLDLKIRTGRLTRSAPAGRVLLSAYPLQQRPWSLPAYRTHVRVRVAGVVIEFPEQTFIRPDGHPVSFALMTMHWLRPNTAGRGSNADGRCAWAAPQSKSSPTTTTIVNFCLVFMRPMAATTSNPNG